jgi:putative flavoprotein involved in K+ transport
MATSPDAARTPSPIISPSIESPVSRREMIMQGNERFQVVIVGGGQGGSRGRVSPRPAKDPLCHSRREPESGRLLAETLGLAAALQSRLLRWASGSPIPAGPRVKPTKDQMGNYLEGYASHFKLPVRSGVRVTRLSRQSEHFLVEAGEKQFEAETGRDRNRQLLPAEDPQVCRRARNGDRAVPLEQVQEPVSASSRRSADRWRGEFGSGNRHGDSEKHPTWLAGKETGSVPVPGGQSRRALPLRAPDPGTGPQHPQLSTRRSGER